MYISLLLVVVIIYNEIREGIFLFVNMAPLNIKMLYLARKVLAMLNPKLNFKSRLSSLYILRSGR